MSASNARTMHSVDVGVSETRLVGGNGELFT